MANGNGRRHGSDHVLATVTVLRKRSGEIETPDRDDLALSELASVVAGAKAEMQHLVQLGELQGDPLRHPIQALTVHLDAMHRLTIAGQTLDGMQQAAITDKQIDDIGLRLMGSAQGWARSFVRTSYWKSQAVLAIVVLGAVLAGAGAGWWAHSPPTELACADQADGSRVCWMFTRLPTAHR